MYYMKIIGGELYYDDDQISFRTEAFLEKYSSISR